jgi:hypothetical protein
MKIFLHKFISYEFAADKKYIFNHLQINLWIPINSLYQNFNLLKILQYNIS